jgi:hypothetical protein
MAQERVQISSDWGNVTAELIDNAATRSLVEMLPLTINMEDHLRQEKTGNLPAPLPAVDRQQGFAIGRTRTTSSGLSHSGLRTLGSSTAGQVTDSFSK